jgi:hypothetical protein
MAQRRSKKSKRRRKDKQRRGRSQQGTRSAEPSRPDGPDNVKHTAGHEDLRAHGRRLLALIELLASMAEPPDDMDPFDEDGPIPDEILETFRFALDSGPEPVVVQVVEALQQMIDSAEEEGLVVDGAPAPQIVAQHEDHECETTAVSGQFAGHKQQQDGCLPPVHTDHQGRPQPDPWRELGLPPPPAGPIDRKAVRAAWHRETLEHPPEAAPERARRLLEARDRLTDPARVVDRELNVLHLPDPEALSLPTLDDQASDEPQLIPAKERLAGLLVLHAMVEDREFGGGPEDRPPPGRHRSNRRGR